MPTKRSPHFLFTFMLVRGLVMALKNRTRFVRTAQPFSQFVMFTVHAVNSSMKNVATLIYYKLSFK